MICNYLPYMHMNFYMHIRKSYAYGFPYAYRIPYAHEIHMHMKFPYAHGNLHAYGILYAYRMHMHMEAEIANMSTSCTPKFGVHKGLLTFYSNFLYYFGHDKWRKILKAHISQQHFKRRQYGYHGEFLLHICSMSKRDVRPYYKSFDGNDFLNYTRDISPAVHNIIDSYGYKELHPIALLYQTGYVLDGEEFETARPFRVPCRQPYKFDFVKYMRSSIGCHEFEFVNVTGGQGKFEEYQQGIVFYTPPDDINIIDKFYVNYRDKVNQEITTLVVKTHQVLDGISLYFMKLPRAIKLNNAYMVMIRNIKNSFFQFGSAMKLHDPGLNGPWIGMAEGVFIPEKTSPHKFIFIHDEDCEFYISDSPLSDDPIKDQKQKYASINGYELNWNKAQNNKYIDLEAGKHYYFRFIVLNNNGGGKGEVGFIYNDNDNIKSVSASMTKFWNQRDDDVNTYEFEPEIENDPTLGHYTESRQIRYNHRKFTVTGNFEPKVPGTNISDILTDFNYSSQKEAFVVVNQPSSNPRLSPPIIYNVDFGEEIKFDRLRLPVPSNELSANLLLSCDGAEIYTGRFVPQAKDAIDFDNIQRCRNITLNFTRNTFRNKAPIVEIEPSIRNAGSTDNIIPATHTKFHITGPGELSRNGVYYNGKGWHLNQTARLTCNVNLNATGDSVVIIGDRHIYYGGGILEVYVGKKFHGKVDTSFVFPHEAKKMATNNYYQSVLYYIDGLERNSTNVISLVARRGKVQIAGILANAELIDVPQPLPELEYPSDENYPEFPEGTNQDDEEITNQGTDEETTNQENPNQGNEEESTDNSNPETEDVPPFVDNEPEENSEITPITDHESDPNEGKPENHDEGDDEHPAITLDFEPEYFNETNTHIDEAKTNDDNTQTISTTGTLVTENSDPNDSKGKTTDGQPDKNQMYIIIGATVGGIVLIAAIVGAVIVIKLHNRKDAEISEDANIQSHDFVV